MKVSIITVSFNSKSTIKSAIESVLYQNYKNIEYIIIDNQSDDGADEIITGYKNKISKIIIEKDKGIYDAMNKGIKNATGDIIGFLNADDIYLNDNVISDVVNAFKNSKADSIYADLIYVDRYNINLVKRLWKSGSYNIKKFKKGWHPPHPTFFVKKSIYEKYGVYDLSFKISSDFELMLRFLYKNKISSFYLNKPVIKMRLGGVSNSSMLNILKGNIDCLKAFKKNKIKVSFLYPLYRAVFKLRQYLIDEKVRRITDQNH